MTTAFHEIVIRRPYTVSPSMSPCGAMAISMPDVKGVVFVVDSGNTRVQQFMPAEEGGERLQEEAEAAAELEGTEKVSKP